MSPRTARGELAPSLDALEAACEGVKREADQLLERARSDLRGLQDVEAELEDGWSGRARIAHRATAARLRGIARMFWRAQLELVPPGDERAGAIPSQLEYIAKAEREDAPWKDAA